MISEYKTINIHIRYVRGEGWVQRIRQQYELELYLEYKRIKQTLI